MGEGDCPLPRSSSTSDITQQLTESFPGIHTNTHSPQLPSFGLSLCYMQVRVYTQPLCLCILCMLKFQVKTRRILQVQAILMANPGFVTTAQQASGKHPRSVLLYTSLLALQIILCEIFRNNIVRFSYVQLRFWFGVAAVREILTTQEKPGL